MQVRKTTKVLANLFLLRAKPSSVPFSWNLLLVLSLLFILSKSLIYIGFVHIVDQFDPSDVIVITYYGAGIIALTWVLILYASLRTALLYYNKLDRFVQLASSMLAVDCILNALLILWLGIVAYFEVPLGAPPNLVSMILILGFVLIMYWQFMVYINILVYGLEVSIIMAGVFSLFYILLQYNLSEIILNVVIKVTNL